MSEVKVAHVSSLDSFLQIYLSNQLQSLREAGYAVSGISSPGPDVPALEAAGVRHVAVPITRNFTPIADLVSLWRLYRVMRRERFTIVHTHNPKPGLLAQLAARLAGVPVVVNTVHGFYFHENMGWLGRTFYVLMEKIAAWCSDVILSQNAEDARTAVCERICPPDKIKWLGNGIDLTVFDPHKIDLDQVARRRRELDIPEGAKVIGFVGRLAARRKGFLTFLQAGAQVARRVPDVRFLILGEADHGKPDAVEPAAARDYGIWDACRFLGQRPNAELPGLYALMDVLVLPSLFEGIPRVVMEAAAMGVPAVATDVKGNREAIKHDQTGVLVPYGDTDAITDSLVALFADPVRTKAMGHAARALAMEHFDERNVFEKIIGEYARLLKVKGLVTGTERVSLTEATP